MTSQTTFLQRTLGRNYKWWYLFQYQIKNSVFYRSSTLIWMIGRLIVLFSTVLIWWLNIQNGSNLYNFKDIFTYYIFGSIVGLGNGVQWNLANHIKSGSISSLLLSPTPVMPRIILADFGWWFFSNLVEIVVLFSVALVGFKYIIFSNFNNFLLYVLCGIIGYMVSIFFSYILGSIAFFLIEIRGILDIQQQTNYLLSGRSIPLNIVNFLQPLVFLPFSFTFYHPMQIYLGKYSTNEIIYVFLGGIIWCIVLYYLAKWVFKLGLKRNESVGL